MNYIFVGQNILGGYVLKGLLKHKRPILVITRLSNNYPNMVEDIALNYNLEYYKTSNINKDHEIISTKPDVIFCSAWGNIIKPNLLNLPKLGWVNFHPSLLPKYRGSSPVTWCLINAERHTGCTAHFMSEKFDEGNLILSRSVNIEIEDNSDTLRKKIGVICEPLAFEVYKILADNPNFVGTKQNQSEASYYPPRNNNEFINLSMSTLEIYNLVRGLSPYPCAILDYNGQNIRIAEVEITPINSHGDNATPFFWDDEDCLLFRSKDYYLKIKKIRINNQIISNYKTCL